MEQSLSSLHPNPGWATQEPAKSLNAGTVSDGAPKSLSSDTSATDMVGKHCILELYDCDPSKLDDETFLRQTITTAAQRAGATLLNLITHRFEPQGVTGLALLAESHISIHTWPENGYAAVDVFTCGDHTMPEKACEVMCEELSAGRHALRSFLRETPAALGTTERTPVIPIAA